jgi:hypothetical protein
MTVQLQHNPCAVPPYKARRRARERDAFCAAKDARTPRPAAACGAQGGAVGAVAHVADCPPIQGGGKALALGGVGNYSGVGAGA